MLSLTPVGAFSRRVRMKLLSRIPSLPSASGIGHGRLRELLEEQLKPKERVTREESRAYGKSLRNRVRIGSVRLTRHNAASRS